MKEKRGLGEREREGDKERHIYRDRWTEREIHRERWTERKSERQRESEWGT